ncbi:PD-(D/E)XK nuclease family protein [Phytoactinopolyspora limicola]|uniref:PD-(D/E)XK nuclease family protein n=1 Tax=Phytoactinopolyspora limicola TaxID=2715536 RepID=UPI00140B39FC|nr:PD-(D/E)XK nuclease family protein [Phytoactinopolyspora limicola]
MPVTMQQTEFGPAAYQALVAAVHECKAADRLAPVTVLVPNERIGVAARRALARGPVGGSAGIAALQVLTIRRLAESVCGERLARLGRRPLTGPLLVAALRAALADAPGVFAPVAQHIGTARALARAYRELRPLSSAMVDTLGAAGDVPAATVRLCRQLRHRLAESTFDEVDLLEAAYPLVARQGVQGSVVVFLPQDVDRPEAALLSAIAEVGELRLILGLTGDPAADRGPVEVCRAVGGSAESAGTPPLAHTVVHASDPDDEVREVARRVLVMLRHSPGFRIGVLYGTANPYARLVHEHLGRAGVAVFGRGMRSTAETRFGRAALRLLALADHQFRRDEVLAFVADAPVRHRGAPVPASAWERISRVAGVVRGTDWQRVREYAERRRTWLADQPDAESNQRSRAERGAEQAEALADFVSAVQAGLARMSEATSWRELATAIAELWSAVLPVEDPEPLPPEERRTVDRIAGIWTSIAGLDGLAGPPDLALLRQLVELELTDDLDRVGRIGEGVHVGPVSEGVGEAVDAIFVVGAAEGLLPARSTDDPLLPDRVRALTGGALPTQADRTARQHRHVLAALSAAPPRRRTVSFPRGDLRRGGARVPSRWLLPSLRALADGGDVVATAWAAVPGLDESPSYAGSVARTPHPATAQEWRQRAVIDHHPSAPDDPIMTRARSGRAARQSAEFTAFDGNLAGEQLPDPTVSGTVSATSLENWAQCPHGYFMRHLLRVIPVEQPEEVVQISALDRGTVMHDILEQVVRRAAAEGWTPGPGEPWPERTREVLDEAASARFAQAEAEGVTGFSLLWTEDSAAIRADLHTWIGEDNKRRAAAALAPIAAEWAFDGVEIPLGDGRSLRVRGKIDRIDLAADGTLVVIDYKTGKPDSYRDLNSDPCHRGQRLQLPLYAMAAQAERAGLTTSDRQIGPIRSEYWFTSRRGGFERIGYRVDDTVVAQAQRALRTIVDGITGGTFLARPNDTSNPMWTCRYCNPDELGEQGVEAAWTAKSQAPELAALRAMLDGEALA